MSRSAGAVSIAAPLTSIPVAMIEIDPIDSALFPFGPEQQQRPPLHPPLPLLPISPVRFDDVFHDYHHYFETQRKEKI